MTTNARALAAVALLAGALACDGTEQPAAESSGGVGSASSGSGQPVAYGRGPGAGMGMGMGRGMGMGPGRGGMGMGPGRGAMGPGRRGMGRMGPGDCPAAVASTTVEQEELEGGAAMVFRTEDEGSVGELRRRVAAMADHHTARHGPGGGPPGRGMGHGRPEGVTPPPESTATSVEIDGGARLEMRPSDPDALDSLRDHVAQAVGRMQGGSCPWMQGGAPTQ